MSRAHSPSAAWSRRDLLRFAALGVPLAGGYLLSEYRPWLDHDGQARESRRGLDVRSAGLARMRELVRYASLAANGHNAQAWRFAIGEDGIDIHPDSLRRLPVVDPADRELWISLGCALENLTIAARAVGLCPEVTYPGRDDVIRVRLTSDAPEAGPLLDAVPLRRNNRSAYDGRSVAATALRALEAMPLEPGVVLRFVTRPADRETVIEYVRQGTLSQYADAAFIDELTQWLRFTRKEALASRDGVFTRLSGNPELPRWIGRMFVAGADPRRQADRDARQLRSSPHGLVIASVADDRNAWVRTGQVYERMALLMTSLGIDSALHNQPLEVAPIRSEFQGTMQLGTSLPQLVMRFGHGPPSPRSLRRNVDDILLTRS